MRPKITLAERFRQALLDAVPCSQESFSGYCQLAAQAMLCQAIFGPGGRITRRQLQPRVTRCTELAWRGSRTSFLRRWSDVFAPPDCIISESR